MYILQFPHTKFMLLYVLLKLTHCMNPQKDTLFLELLYNCNQAQLKQPCPFTM